jgi:hypothetical protein
MIFAVHYIMSVVEGVCEFVGSFMGLVIVLTVVGFKAYYHYLKLRDAKQICQKFIEHHRARVLPEGFEDSMLTSGEYSYLIKYHCTLKEYESAIAKAITHGKIVAAQIEFENAIKAAKEVANYECEL